MIMHNPTEVLPSIDSHSKHNIIHGIPIPDKRAFGPCTKELLTLKSKQTSLPLWKMMSSFQIFCKKQNFFASQCTIEDNWSTLPPPTFKTDDPLSYFEININQIINIINKFSPNKSHGHDGISVAMLQLCSSQVAIPPQMIFQSSFPLSGNFSDIWK